MSTIQYKINKKQNEINQNVVDMFDVQSNINKNQFFINIIFFLALICLTILVAL